ncbi:ferredoxin-type protein NapF [Epsilonproteobacteria bacterium SCGC AD-308-O04]|jgi:ferredoxin-type protein NapF|nr:ferredoxin-type protein NapF [Epsilonproteobacteria bacterium SCGC AD-308-O04]
MQRRELFSFLSSSLKDEEKKVKEQILRPPYYNDINAFDTECQNCDGKCATLCQEQIIIIEDDKTPRLDFSKSGCTYCDDCAIACEFGVLNIEDKKMIDANVVINQSTCLSWSGVMCFSCKDPCLEDAIEFKAMFMPVIDESKCTACGFCISRCPTYAIEVSSL